MRAMIPDAECEVHKNDTLRNRSTDLESLVDAVSAHASKKKEKKKALNHDQEQKAVQREVFDMVVTIQMRNCRWFIALAHTGAHRAHWIAATAWFTHAARRCRTRRGCLRAVRRRR